MKALLLSWFVSFPAWHGDLESPQERLERLTMAAEQCASAINNARCAGPWSGADWCSPVWSDSPELLAASLATLWLFESGGARHIHEGRCRLALGECDAWRYRGRLVPGSISPWQFKRTAAVSDQWAEARAAGATPVGTFAGCLGAARVFGRAYAACGSLEGAFAAYARGQSCSWSGARRRADFARRLITRRPGSTLEP